MWQVPANVACHLSMSGGVSDCMVQSQCVFAHLCLKHTWQAAEAAAKAEAQAAQTRVDRLNLAQRNLVEEAVRIALSQHGLVP